MATTTATGQMAGGDRIYQNVQLKFATMDANLLPSIWLAKFSSKDGKLHLNKNALSLLKTFPQNKPVAVLSICGPYRSGKSFFLSRMLGTNDAFKVSSEMDPCTEGIWMSTIVLECDDFVVVLLDTEGTNAAQESEEFSTTDVTKLLVLTTLLSSYLIYNQLGAPTKKDIEKMSCFSTISKTILLCEGSSAADHLHEKNLQRFFPQFLWLLRDSELEPKIEGRTVSLTEYVRKRILVQSKQKSSSRDETVRTILALFPSLECRGTPRPGKPLEKDLSFLSAIDAMAAQLLNDIQPKMSFEHEIPINGSILASLIEQYVHALNEPGAVPNLELSWVQAVKHHLIEKCRLLVTEYCQEMKQKLQRRLPIEEGDLNDLQTQQPSNTLARIHQEIFETKLTVIQTEATHTLPSNKEEGDKLITIHFQRKIVHVQDRKVTEGELSHFVERNHKLSRQYCEQLLDKLCKEQEEIQLQKLKDDFFKSALGPAKEEVYQKGTKDIPGPPLKITVDSKTVGKAKVTWNQPDINPIAAKHYEAHVQEEPSKTWEQHTTAIKEIEINVKPNTNYRIRIRGLNETRHGEYSKVVTFKTPPGKPDKPKKPHITIDSPTSATFLIQRLPKEKENGSPVTHVIVEKSTLTKSCNAEWLKDRPQFISSGAQLLKLQVVTTNVTQDATYLFRIRFGNEAGESVPSDAVKIAASSFIPGEPLSLKLLPQARSVQLSWKPPNVNPASVQCYKIHFKQDLDANWEQLSISGSTTTCTVVKDLLPMTTYCFQLSCSNVDGTAGKIHPIVSTRTKPDCPNQPQRPISISMISPTKACLTIQKLKQSEENGSPVKTVIVQRSSKRKTLWVIDQKINLQPGYGVVRLNITLPNVTSDEPWLYRIKMVNSVGESKASDCITVLPGELIPGPPVNLKSVHVTPSSIKIAWDAPKINPASAKWCTIEYKAASSSSSSWTILSLMQSMTYRNATKQGLLPNTKYSFRVSCINGRKTGISSKESITATTLACPPNRPQKPTIYIDSALSATLTVSRLLSRDENGSPVNSIIIEKWSEANQCWKVKTESRLPVGDGNMSFTLALENTTLHKYRVRMRNAAGIGEASEEALINVSDMIPGKPQNVHAKNVTSNSLLLVWTVPRTNPVSVDSYQVVKNPYQIISRYNQPTFKNVTGLKPNKEYEFYVYANNKSGVSGQSSNLLRVRTLSCPPKLVKQPRLQVISLNRAVIRVTKPKLEDSGSPVNRIIVYRYNEQNIPLPEEEYPVSRHHRTETIRQNIKIDDTTRLICMRLGNTVGTSEHSEFLTLDFSNVEPGSPKYLEVSVETLCGSTAVLKWERPDRVADSYSVEVRKMTTSTLVASFHTMCHSLKIPNLKPCTSYEFRVYSMNGSVKGDYSELFKTIPAGVPEKPSKPRIKVHDSNPCKAIMTVKMPTKSQENGSPVNYLIVEEWNLDSESWERNKRTRINTDYHWHEEKIKLQNATESDLSIEDDYYFRIVLKNAEGESEPSEEVLLPIADLLPGAVTDLQVETTAHEAYLEWEEPNVNPIAVSEYEIYLLDENTWKLLHSTEETSTTVYNLKSDHTFTFRIDAVNYKDKNGPQNTIDATTKELFPNRPTNLRVVGVQANAIKLRWNKPSGDPEATDSYEIKARRSGRVERRSYTRGCSKVIRGLEPSETYTFTVTARNARRNSRYYSSATIEEETKMSGIARVALKLFFGVPTLGVGAAVVGALTDPDKNVYSSDED